MNEKKSLETNKSVYPKKRYPISLLGPVLVWEMVRLGRRFGPFFIRISLVLIISLSLFLTFEEFWGSEKSSYSEMDSFERIIQTNEQGIWLERLSNRFIETFFYLQVILISLALPILIAGGLTEDRERKTLEFLLTTDLSNWEIMIGKVGSRIFLIIMLLMSCIPALTILTFVGKIDVMQVVCGYLLLATVGFGIVGIASFTAVARSTFRGIIFRSYFTIGFVYFGIIVIFEQFERSPWIYFLDPFEILKIFIYDQSNLWVWSSKELHNKVLPFITVNFMLGITGLSLAIFRFRKKALAINYRPSGINRSFRNRKHPKELPVKKTTNADANGPLKATNAGAEKPAPRHWADPPPIGKFPLYWREVHFASQPHIILRLLMVIPNPVWLIMGATSWGALLTYFWGNSNLVSQALEWCLVWSTFCVSLSVLTMGFASCGTVLRDRQKATLMELFTIPSARSALLRAKAFACFRRAHILISLLLIQWFFLLIYGMLPILFFFVLAVYFMSYFILAISLGLFLSTRCKSVFSATIWWLGIVGIFLFSINIYAQINGGTNKARQFLYLRSIESRENDVFEITDLPIFFINEINPATGCQIATKMIPMKDLTQSDPFNYSKPYFHERWWFTGTGPILYLFLSAILFYLANKRFQNIDFS